MSILKRSYSGEQYNNASMKICNTLLKDNTHNAIPYMTTDINVFKH